MDPHFVAILMPLMPPVAYVWEVEVALEPALMPPVMPLHQELMPPSFKAFEGHTRMVRTLCAELAARTV